MNIKKYFFSTFLLILIFSTSLTILAGEGVFKRIELLTSDVFYRLRKPLYVNPNIVVIQIDDGNIGKIGRWPWDRKWLAAMVKALHGLGARFVFFDIILSEKSTAQDDMLFSEAIKEAGNVYLPFAIQKDADSEGSCILKPIDELLSYTKGTGSVNINPDLDGVIRKLPLYFYELGKIEYHMGLRLAMDYLGMDFKRISRDELIIGNAKDTRRIPLIEGNKMIINWTGKWQETFRHYSFLDVLAAYKDTLDHKTPSIKTAVFKDSICVVAVTALGLYDIKAVPMEAEYPGIGVTVTAFNNILSNQFVRTAPRWIQWLFIYFLSFLPLLLISEEKPMREILSLGSIGIVFFIGYFLFKRGIWIDISVPLIALLGSYIIVGTYNFARISMERRQFLDMSITDELTGLYNIRHFRNLIKTERINATVDASQNFCILMIDIDDFKKFNDSYGHQVGDLVLEQVAKVIKISVRASDVAVRYGGEEIVILLRGTLLEDAMHIAETIRYNVEQHIIRDKDNIYKVTVSIGVASLNNMDDTVSIIKRADQGLYQAKQTGRNRIYSVEAV